VRGRPSEIISTLSRQLEREILERLTKLIKVLKK